MIGIVMNACSNIVPRLQVNQMGLFDELYCRFELPVPAFQDWLFQTKSLDCDMDLYEIRHDGTLWREDYDVEDQSDPNAEGIMALVGCMARVNKRWRQVTDFTGEIRFYDCLGDQSKVARTGWIEFSAYFVNGALQSLNLVSHTEPQTA